MSSRGMTRAELHETFKDAVRSSEILTKEEAEEIREEIEQVSEGSYTPDELKQKLPSHLWTEVQEHLSDPGDGEVPAEDGAGVDKAIPQTPFSQDPGFSEDVVEKDAAGALDHFYDEVDG